MDRLEAYPGEITAPTLIDQISGLSLPLMGVFGDLGDWAQALSDITGFTGLRNITERAIHPSVMDPGPFSAENIMDSIDALGMLGGIAEVAPYAQPAMENLASRATSMVDLMATRTPSLANEIGAVGPGVDEIIKAGKAPGIILPSEGLTTPSRLGKQLRGPRADGINNYDNFVNFLIDYNVPIDPEYQITGNLAEDWGRWAEIAKDMPSLDPIILPGKGNLGFNKISPDLGLFPEGMIGYGNNKTGAYSPTHCFGKGNIDTPGCGRGGFIEQVNDYLRMLEVPEIPGGPCYNMSSGLDMLECYASKMFEAKGSDFVGGKFKHPIGGKERKLMEEYLMNNGIEMFKQNYPKVLVKGTPRAYDIKIPKDLGISKEDIITQIIEEGPFAVERLQKQYPEITFAPPKAKPGEKPRVSKWSISRETDYPAGAAYLKYPRSKPGITIRGGVTNTGDTYYREEIMNAIYEAVRGNKNPFVFISANYHTNPDAVASLARHPMQKQSILNNTVSGWFSPPELLSRVYRGDLMKEAGWNSTWRIVNSDPKTFPEAVRFNRYTEAFDKATDMPYFFQPLHTVGGAYNKYSGVPEGLMGCCESPAPGRLSRTCANCEVGDGMAPQFLDSWGIVEGSEAKDKLFPSIPDFVDDARKRKPFAFDKYR